jgi:two-component sensor histidine kinase
LIRCGVSLSIKEAHVTLIVEDSGIGIFASIDSATSIGFGMQLVDMAVWHARATDRRPERPVFLRAELPDVFVCLLHVPTL